MIRVLDPENIDLAELAAVLSAACGATISGEVIGRTRLRDVVVQHLDCSQLEAELIVDTMIGRGFVRRQELPGHVVQWVIGG